MYNTHLKPPLLNKPPQPNPNPFPRLANLELTQTLSSGITHKTKLGLDIVTKQKYAVKIFKSNMSSLFTAMIEEEATIHTLLSESHPNILKLEQYIPNGNYIKKNGTIKNVCALVMEFSEEENLFEHLQNYGPLAEDAARTYFTLLLNSVDCIHSNGIVHTNLRPENIILSAHQTFKISDFSFARYISTDTESLNQNRPPQAVNYLAPELLINKDSVGFYNDIFSCGVLLFILVTGYPPFNQACSQDVYFNLIKRRQFSSFWKQHERQGCNVTRNFKDLINGMLACEPSERLTLPEITMHPWVLEADQSSDMISQPVESRNATRNMHAKGKLIHVPAKKEVSKASERVSQPRQGAYAMRGIQVLKP